MMTVSGNGALSKTKIGGQEGDEEVHDRMMRWRWMWMWVESTPPSFCICEVGGLNTSRKMMI
jgi:hypothetical protein